MSATANGTPLLSNVKNDWASSKSTERLPSEWQQTPEPQSSIATANCGSVNLFLSDRYIVWRRRLFILFLPECCRRQYVTAFRLTFALLRRIHWLYRSRQSRSTSFGLASTRWQRHPPLLWRHVNRPRLLAVVVSDFISVVFMLRIKTTFGQEWYIIQSFLCPIDFASFSELDWISSIGVSSFWYQS